MRQPRPHKAQRRRQKRIQEVNPCPATGSRSGACPGYIIDHVVQFNRGGANAPGNMQWQTKDAAKAKDESE